MKDMFRITFVNSNEAPIHIQIDPWAGLYRLQKGEEIVIAAECEGESPCFDIEEHGDTRIVLLVNCSEYYVVQDEKLIHWTEFTTNIKE